MGSGEDEVTRTRRARNDACVEWDPLRTRPSKEARANAPSMAYLPLQIKTERTHQDF